MGEVFTDSELLNAMEHYGWRVEWSGLDSTVDGEWSVLPNWPQGIHRVVGATLRDTLSSAAMRLPAILRSMKPAGAQRRITAGGQIARRDVGRPPRTTRNAPQRAQRKRAPNERSD